ncbi:MAG: hypothetical protein AAF333_10985 [Planctomycetota bacterium]
MSRVLLSGVALAIWGGLPAAAQSPAPSDGGTTAGATSPEVVVVTQRPLRTFRGDTVRVGRAAPNDLSIGVVRPIRAETRRRGGDCDQRGFSRTRFGVSRFNTFNSRFTGPNDLSIGVVRAFRRHDPVERFAPVTHTNPLAQDEPVAASTSTAAPAYEAQPATVGPLFPLHGAEVVAVREVAPTPDIDPQDPWALLNVGRYRDALDRFGTHVANDTPETQTGRALAAALSGDLARGAEFMPEAPVVPAGLVLNAATAQRIELTRQFLYEDDPAAQVKLRRLLDVAKTKN